MENLLEILVPLIFAAIYFFGNMLSSKSDEEGPSPRGRSAPMDEETAERQRRIQDEIRRKIMERRQAATGESAPTPQPAQQGKALRERRKAVAQRLEKRRTIHEQHKETHEAAPHLAPTHEIETDKAPGGFSWDESDNAYEQNIQAQLRQIEETKRRAAALRRQTKSPEGAISPSSVGREPRRASRGGLLSGSVRDVLRNPSAARAAFIYGEVLGKPISLRKSTDALPGQG